MALTVTSAISSLDRWLTVTGTVPDDVAPGFEFAIDDELLVLDYFDTTNPYATPVTVNRNRWRIRRGVAGTERAAHLAGADVLATTPEYVEGAGLTKPSPFEAGGGATPTLAEVLAEGGDPLSRLVVHMASSLAAQAGDGSDVFYVFDTVDESVGEDIEVDGLDATKINILTAGTYAVAMQVLLLGDGPVKSAFVSTFPAMAFGYVQSGADGYNRVGATLGATRFLEAYTVIQLAAALETDNGTDTWALSSGSLVSVQRVA